MGFICQGVKVSDPLMNLGADKGKGAGKLVFLVSGLNSFDGQSVPDRFGPIEQPGPTHCRGQVSLQAFDFVS